MTSPLVSIVIPSYLSSSTIIETLESVVGQKFVGEIIVSLNGHDNSEELISEFQNLNPQLNVKILEPGKEILSAAENWKRAVSAANYEFTKLLCADDELLNSSIQFQADFLKEHIDCVLVSGTRRITDCGGQVLKQNHGGLFLIESNTSKRLLFAGALTGGNPAGEPSAILFRTEQLKLAMPWSEVNPYVIDFEMYFRILKSTGMKMGFMNREVSTFRVSSLSWSAQLVRMQGVEFRNLIIGELRSLNKFVALLFIGIVAITSRLSTLGRKFFYWRVSRRSKLENRT